MMTSHAPGGSKPMLAQFPRPKISGLPISRSVHESAGKASTRSSQAALEPKTQRRRATSGEKARAIIDRQASGFASEGWISSKVVPKPKRSRSI